MSDDSIGTTLIAELDRTIRHAEVALGLARAVDEHLLMSEPPPPLESVVVVNANVQSIGLVVARNDEGKLVISVHARQDENARVVLHPGQSQEVELS